MLRHDLERHSLPGAGRAGDETVAIGQAGQKREFGSAWGFRDGERLAHWDCSFAAFRLAAQNFFMRTLTALRAEGDMGARVAPFSASSPELLAMRYVTGSA